MTTTTMRKSIRIVVAGDANTGKSSLIQAAISEKSPAAVPLVLPPSALPSHFPKRVPSTIIDTPSGNSAEHTEKRAEEFQRADVVVLTYDCDRPDTLERVTSYWLPELRRIKPEPEKLPVIVAGCKSDLIDDQQRSGLGKVVSQIVNQIRDVEVCIQCSAKNLILIVEVFHQAQFVVFYPTAPLYDQGTTKLSPQCVNALKRIFILCDLDGDGALNDAEFTETQAMCITGPPKRSEIVDLKRTVQERVSDGVNERGFTLEGFLYLHKLSIEKGRTQPTWSCLRKFGYNIDIRLDHLLSPFKRAPDQSVELTKAALAFLRGIFGLYVKDNDGDIASAAVEDLFSTAPDSPWSESPYLGAASTTALNGFTLNGFLSEWVLMTLLEPAKSVEYLKYIMYDGDAASAIRLTRKRHTDRNKRQSEKNVYQCFVFGPKNAGKSALLDGFLGRPFSDASIPNTEERYAVNVVDGTAGSQKFLVLREIPEAKVENLLTDKDSLASCDVALFLYDRTDESSFKKTAKLLAEVARLGEDTGYEVPSLIVSAKGDMDSYANSVHCSTKLCQNMGIDAPVPISAKQGKFSDIFQKMVTTAEHPHLSILETKAGRSRKRYIGLVRRSLLAVSVGAAVFAGLAACRVVYAARRDNSS